MGTVMEAANQPRKTRCILVAVLVSMLVATSGCAGQDSAGTVPATGPTTTAADVAVAPEPSTTTAATRSSSATTAASEPAPTPSTTTTTLPPLQPVTFESLGGINTIPDFAGYTASGMSRWQQAVPGVEDIRITSTADGAQQPALWLAPTGTRDRPLLVILHSWSAGYLQHAGIPYAMWAQENGWAVIAPQFRGVNDDPTAIGSDLAVQDVADAIDWATSRDGVEGRRVYAVGYSGGGMMSLLLAGRHPDKVTAVAAWGPPIDLVQFYRRSRATGRHYARDIRAGCGGDPTASTASRQECLRRSPMTYLTHAREQGVPVFIAQGIFDSLLSPRQGARAFNQLADPEDRFSQEELSQVGRGSLPDHLSGSITTETYFGAGDPAPVFVRRSSDTWLVFFNSGHDMAYKATLRWFASDPR